jgi:hypothetical protein
LSKQRASPSVDAVGRACCEACRLRRLTVEGDVRGVISTMSNLIEVGGPLRDKRAAASLSEIAVEWGTGWQGIRDLGTGGRCEVCTGEQKHAKGRRRHAVRFRGRS